jgi:hypothetical protein
MTTTATTAFQVIFDLAESIGIDRRGIVAQTTTRNNSVRAISRGGQVWRFTVKLPDGLSWSQARPYIEAIDAADRSTTGLVGLSNTNYTSWLSAYQGNSVNSTGFTATATQGSTTLTLTASPTTASGYKFRAGDLIQLGTTGHAYSVVSDVAYNSNTVTLNRAVIGTSGSYNLRVGPAVTWRVLCTNMPTWTIFARDQVSWSGAFEFVEALNDY